jgi:chaperonin GroEL
MSKVVKYKSAAKAAISSGVNKLTDCIKVTLGPKGRNVILRREYQQIPHVTKDGVTIAKEIFLKDPFEDMGVQMVKHAASTTCDEAGDGTTTAVVLAQAIFSSGLRMMSGGHNPMDLKRGIDKAVKVVVEHLDVLADNTQDPERIKQVGTISANGDETIGKLIADGMEKVGREGVITIEEGGGLETTLAITEGMQFDRGYLSGYFINRPERSEVVLDNCRILISDGRLDSMEELVEILQEAAGKGPLLIIAEDVGGTALPGLVVNKIQGRLNVCAVKAPGFGDRRGEMLKDIAVLTNAQCLSSEIAHTVKDATLEDFGLADKVVVTRNSTTIIGGKGDREMIEGRIDQIRKQIEDSTSDWEREQTRERLAKLVGGVAVIGVGAATEAELKEKKDRVEDAMHATRAAVEEGIVPGGGLSLLKCSDVVSDVMKSLGPGEREGALIILNALSAPVSQIAENAGENAGMVVAEIIKRDYKQGWNAATEKYEDLTVAGVIDPKKVVRCALQNAASVASLLLTTEAIVADVPDDDKKNKTPTS